MLPILSMAQSSTQAQAEARSVSVAEQTTGECSQVSNGKGDCVLPLLLLAFIIPVRALHLHQRLYHGAKWWPLVGAPAGDGKGVPWCSHTAS
jgi:hypothetical protein